MIGELTDKIAFVSGGASGIGAAIASAYANAGAFVIIGDRDRVGGLAQAEALGSMSRFVGLDVTQADDWHALARETPQIDILVNCAGMNVLGDIETMTPEAWRRGFEVNVTGAMLATQILLPTLKRDEAPGSTIINIASAAGLKPYAAFPGYGATKAALIYLTRSVALHCADKQYNIRCNAICPGMIETPIFKDMGGGDVLDALAREFLPVKRMGQPNEVADLACYLASDRSAFMTGSVVSIDGGQAIA